MQRCGQNLKICNVLNLTFSYKQYIFTLIQQYIDMYPLCCFLSFHFLFFVISIVLYKYICLKILMFKSKLTDWLLPLDGQGDIEKWRGRSLVSFKLPGGNFRLRWVEFLLETHDGKLRAVGALLEFDCEKYNNPTCGRDDGVKNKITEVTEPPSLRYVSSRSDIA